MLHVVQPLLSKDTLVLAKWLRELAETGKIRGIAATIRLPDGSDEVIFAGDYHARAMTAVTAAARMYWVASSKADKEKK